MIYLTLAFFQKHQSVHGFEIGNVAHLRLRSVLLRYPSDWQVCHISWNQA